MNIIPREKMNQINFLVKMLHNHKEVEMSL